jgi:hypothetical protein
MPSYPIYYEDAAHIAHVLTKNGLRLKTYSTYLLLMWVSFELEMFARSNPSHSTAGGRLVDILSGESGDAARRRRFEAIAGTLVGNFLLTCKRTAHAQK